MKYKNNTEKDIMVNLPSKEGHNPEWIVVVAGKEAELSITEDYASRFGLVLASEEEIVEVEAEESEVSGAEGSMKVETKKVKKRGKN